MPQSGQARPREAPPLIPLSAEERLDAAANPSPQRGPVHLPDGVFRQRIDEMDAGRDVGSRQSTCDHGLELAGAGGGARPRLHERDGNLAEIGVRPADDAARLHPGAPLQHALDRPGRQVLAAPDDDVLEAAGDEQIPVGVEPAEVAGPQPAVAENRGGRPVDVALPSIRPPRCRPRPRRRGGRARSCGAAAGARAVRGARCRRCRYAARRAGSWSTCRWPRTGRRRRRAAARTPPRCARAGSRRWAPSRSAEAAATRAGRGRADAAASARTSSARRSGRSRRAPRSAPRPPRRGSGRRGPRPRPRGAARSTGCSRRSCGGGASGGGAGRPG